MSIGDLMGAIPRPARPAVLVAVLLASVGAGAVAAFVQGTAAIDKRIEAKMEPELQPLRRRARVDHFLLLHLVEKADPGHADEAEAQAEKRASESELAGVSP